MAGGRTGRSHDHAELEDHLSAQVREAVRQLYQDHLDLRSQLEQGFKAVASATGAVHGAVEVAHERSVATVFGEVRVRRIAYRARGHANLCQLLRDEEYEMVGLGAL